MLSTCDDLASQLEGRKSLVHAALKAKNEAILVVILNKDPSLADERDEKGKTCLSVGASVGYYEGVCCLLDMSTDCPLFVCDDDGFFPIHMAAKYGHLIILKKILKRHPDTLELLSKYSQNILHVATKYGQLKAIKFTLKCYKDGNMGTSINEQDADGNIPLHLATKNAQPKVVSMLTLDDRVDVKITNYGSKTALDIAVDNMAGNSGMLEILTWVPLVSAGAPRGTQQRLRTPDLSDGPVKELVNTLLLVTTLVATMTFTVGFALPGGYNCSVPNLGMAALAKKKAFQVFLVFNTLAMYSSIITIVALIWAQLGDPSLLRKALVSDTLALPFLGISLIFMSISFMSGTFAAVSHIPLLSYFILGIGLIFLVGSQLIIIPYVYPNLFTNPFLRYIFYFPYFLLLWAVGDNRNNENNE